MSGPGKLNLIGLFGFPVEHSLSPAMHNAAIAALHLSYSYIPFSVRPEDLGPAIRSLKILSIRGVNLTIPHKISALPFMDEVTDEVKMVGAMNTVVNEDGRLVGHTTDGAGLSRSLAEIGFCCANKPALILGAGGAARSAAFQLAKEGSSLILVNRTIDRAETLAQDIARYYPSTEVDVVESRDEKRFRKSLLRAEFLVNATSVGMYPDVDVAPPIPSNSLHPNLTTLDMIYNPHRTRLLIEAEAAGGKVVNGLPMLVYQGAESFRIWTGIDPPTDVMLQTAEGILRDSRTI
ncbi:MAG: shikimate dehydrogenase [Chthonomonadales bacterium]